MTKLTNQVIDISDLSERMSDRFRIGDIITLQGYSPEGSIRQSWKVIDKRPDKLIVVEIDGQD